MILRIFIHLLAVILWLLLLMILLFLFGPVSWSLKGSFDTRQTDQTEGKLRVAWLWHLLRLEGCYADGRFYWTFRIFGILIRQKTPDPVSGAKRSGQDPFVMDSHASGEPFPSDAHSAEKQRSRISPVRSQKHKKISPKSKNKPEKSPAVWIRFFLEPETRQILRAGRKKLIRLIRTLSPRFISGKVVFGMRDPAVTGYLTGAASLFLPLTQKLKLIPVFDTVDSFGCGEGILKGWFTAFQILFLLVPLILDRRIRRLIRFALH